MKTIYIDERFVKSENKTIFSIVVLSDKELKEIYNKVKQVIIKKEVDEEVLPKLLSDIKLYKLHYKKYWPHIEKTLKSIYPLSESHILDASKEDDNFEQKYANWLDFLSKKKGFRIVIDIIDNKTFTNKILSFVTSKSVTCSTSHEERGLQIADLLMHKYCKI